ncbi:hypothetical protein [Streptomyces sp. NBC_01216]|uniref:hypothetical protein n=1 Tax=unclassified Streptomyces TaxID=2593676 RepID=UPI002E129D2F|nr:hypothetical protein OG393_01300 [Streptomyces sp. NBC_01216]
MAPLSADQPSFLRYLLVPLVTLLAVALWAAALLAGGDEPGDRGAGDAARRGSPENAGTTQAGGRRPAAQGGLATGDPSGEPSPAPSPSHTRPHLTASASPRTSRRPSTTPSTPSAVPFHRLTAGECFDIDRSAPGTVTRRACDRPHDAQAVALLRLTGDFASDRDVRDGAARLCREPLRRKAAAQPRGTRWTTFVQYPFRTSYLLGADTVACSLAVNAGTATDASEGRITTPGSGTRPGAVRKLTAPLR